MALGSDLFHEPLPTDEELADAPVTPTRRPILREDGVEPPRTVAAVTVQLLSGGHAQAPVKTKDTVCILLQRALTGQPAPPSSTLVKGSSVLHPSDII